MLYKIMCNFFSRQRAVTVDQVCKLSCHLILGVNRVEWLASGGQTCFSEPAHLVIVDDNI